MQATFLYPTIILNYLRTSKLVLLTQQVAKLSETTLYFLDIWEMEELLTMESK